MCFFTRSDVYGDYFHDDFCFNFRMSIRDEKLNTCFLSLLQ